MRNLTKATLWPALLAAGLILGFSAAPAPQPAPARRAEYVTIRWDGRDNTHLIRPGGQVEHIGAELRRFDRPSRTDERCFYLNVAINGLAKEGYEVAAMNEDEILMRRWAP